MKLGVDRSTDVRIVRRIVHSCAPALPLRSRKLWTDGPATRPDDVATGSWGTVKRRSLRLTFGELRRRAVAIAARLNWLNAHGDRAILLYPQGLEFIVAFFGCLYAGVVAVPVSVPNRKRGHEILRRIAADAGARWLLSTGELLEKLSADPSADTSLGGLSYVDTEACDSTVQDEHLPAVGPKPSRSSSIRPGRPALRGAWP